LIKGQLADITKTPSPAYIHHPISNLALVKNDLSFCTTTMKKAALCTDPVQRMKLIVTHYIQSQFINPTLMQCRAPINPIIGETYQREMPSGVKIYCE